MCKLFYWVTAMSAFFTCSTIYQKLLCKITGLTTDAGKVTQGGATFIDRQRQRELYRIDQFLHARQRDISSFAFWVYPGTKQRFTGVDITDPDQDMAVHDQRLDRTLPLVCFFMQVPGIEIIFQRFRAQRADELVLADITGLP